MCALSTTVLVSKTIWSYIPALKKVHVLNNVKGKYNEWNHTPTIWQRPCLLVMRMNAPLIDILGSVYMRSFSRTQMNVVF